MLSSRLRTAEFWTSEVNEAWESATDLTVVAAGFDTPLSRTYNDRPDTGPPIGLSHTCSVTHLTGLSTTINMTLIIAHGKHPRIVDAAISNVRRHFTT